LWRLPCLSTDKFLVSRKKALPRHPNLVYEISYDGVLHVPDCLDLVSHYCFGLAGSQLVPRIVDCAGTLRSVVGRMQSVGAPFISSVGDKRAAGKVRCRLATLALRPLSGPEMMVSRVLDPACGRGRW